MHTIPMTPACLNKLQTTLLIVNFHSPACVSLLSEVGSQLHNVPQALVFDSTIPILLSSQDKHQLYTMAPFLDVYIHMHHSVVLETLPAIFHMWMFI